MARLFSLGANQRKADLKKSVPDPGKERPAVTILLFYGRYLEMLRNVEDNRDGAARRRDISFQRRLQENTRGKEKSVTRREWREKSNCRCQRNDEVLAKAELSNTAE